MNQIFLLIIMTMKKVMKIVIALLIAILLVMTFSQIVSATGGTDPTSADLTQMFNKKDNSGASDAASNIISTIINIIQIVGTGVAIIMLIVLAIQYIAASPEGKAEIKKNSTIYIVGAVILFAASGILGIIRRFAVQNVGDEGQSLQRR